MGCQKVAVPICVTILKTHKGQVRKSKSLCLYVLNFCYARECSGLKRVEGKDVFTGLLRRKYLPVQKMQLAVSPLS